ncbi:MAG: hypothetical protein WB608_01555 [Terracidiphilus sp.]
MNTTKKTNSEPIAADVTEKTDALESAVTLYIKGVERLAEIQKKGIELATKQNAELIDTWKKLAEAVPYAPSPVLLDWATNAFEQYAEARKGTIDLVVEHTRAMAGLVKNGTSSAADATDGAVALVKEMVDRSVTTQKKALEFYSSQTKTVFENAKRVSGLAGPAAAAADSFQRGVDTLIASQIEFLGIAAKPFTTVH